MTDLDLANLGTRRGAQSRITNNRDTVLPTRRLTDAPALRNFEDMRNARRGGGEADAIKQALGMVTDTVGAALDLGTKQHAVKAEADAAQGKADEAMGVVDPAKEKQSLAYHTAIAMSRARKKSAETELILRPEIEDYLNKGADADPTKGEHPADLEGVNQLIEDRFKALVLGPDGKPIDFGDAAANMEVYSQLEEMRPRLLTAAQTIIRKQEATKVIRGFGDEIELDIAKTGKADVEKYMGRLPAGVDRNDARSEFMAAAVNAAAQNEKPEVLEALADSRRGDGQPSWTPQQEGHLRDTARTLRNQLEIKHDKELRETSLDTLATLSFSVRSGHKLDPVALQKLVAEHKLAPEHVETAFALQEKMDDEAWETQQRARANISWAQSQSDRREAKASQGGAGAAAASQQLRANIIAGNLTPGEAHHAATKLFLGGQIDMKTYDFLADEAKHIPTNDKAVKDADAALWERQLMGNFKAARDYAGKPGKADLATYDARAATAMVEFYRALRQGDNGDRAYARALATVTSNPAAIRKGVETGRERQANRQP